MVGVQIGSLEEVSILQARSLFFFERGSCRALPFLFDRYKRKSILTLPEEHSKVAMQA